MDPAPADHRRDLDAYSIYVLYSTYAGFQDKHADLLSRCDRVEFLAGRQTISVLGCFAAPWAAAGHLPSYFPKLSKGWIHRQHTTLVYIF